jgi:MFS transporter, DHA2 family, multidrug resistance protein
MSDTAAKGPASAHDVMPMTGPMLWVGGLLLALANFMAVLDITIANVSVPNIAGGLAVSPSQGAWVITSYAVAEAITVPLTGWLSQRFGAVKVFIVAMAGFGLFSALCGLAPSLGVLVVFRILQGLSGGPMMPLSQTLLRRIFPLHLQPTAMGLWGMTTVVGPIIGPLLGGYLVDHAGWPWVFYVNVPVAVVTGVLAWRVLRSRETPTQRVPVDIVGLGLLITFVGAMQIMLDKGREMDWFQSPFILGLAIIALIGFISFIIWELTDAHPIVDLRVFRHRGFAASTVIMSLTYGAFFSSVVLVPLWLQTNMGYTAGWAGRAMAFQGILAVVMSPIVARLMGRIDLRALVCFGVLVMAGVGLWRSTFASNMDFMSVSWPNLVQGMAMPFFFIPTTALALASVLPQETASAAGLMNFMRTTAGAFGTSISLTAWQNADTVQRNDLVGALHDPQGAMDQMAHAGLSAGQALGQLDNLVESQATMAATNHIFLVVSMIFVLGAMAVWIAPKPAPLVGGPPAGGH